MENIIFFINENITLVSLWFICLTIAIFFMAKNIFLKTKIINNIEAIKLINQDNAIVIDTRDSDIFKKGHIIHSINISLRNIFLGNIKDIEVYKSVPIILILHETYKYNKCIQEFLKHGFKRIYILNSGIYCWNLEHLPLITKDQES